METSRTLKHFLILILLIPSYAQGTSCQDNHHNCAMWAADGACKNSPDSMNVTCPATCRICKPLGTDETLLGASSLIFPKTDTEVHEGEEVQLDCGVKGEKRRCLWQTNNGTDIQVQDVLDGVYLQYGKPSISKTNNQCGITIRNVTRDDEGKWTCKVMIRGDPLLGYLTLSVIDPTQTKAPDTESNTTLVPTDGYQDSSEPTAPEDEYPHTDDDSTLVPGNNNHYSDYTSISPRLGKGIDWTDNVDNSTSNDRTSVEITTPGVIPSSTDNHNALHSEPQAATADSEEESTETDEGNALWISLIVISLILLLLLLISFCWYFFCSKSDSHDIQQMDGSRQVEMIPIVRDSHNSGELETIAEEQSISQPTTDVKVEIHNEQEVDVPAGKEEDKGISNKAFADQEENNTQDDKSEADKSDSSDQNDQSSKEEDVNGVTNKAFDSPNGDTIEEGSRDQKENSDKKESSSESSDSESSDSSKSSEGEKVEDKEIQDVGDDIKDSDSKDSDSKDSDSKDEQSEEVKDDDKAIDVDTQETDQNDSVTQNGMQADVAQESTTPQADIVIQHVEGEASPFQDAVLINLHNGEVYEEETQEKDDGDTKKE